MAPQRVYKDQDELLTGRGEKLGWQGINPLLEKKEHPTPSELSQKMHSIIPNHVGKCVVVRQDKV